LKTLCLPDNINISKLNFSLSLFAKCHIPLYCIVRVLCMKLSMCRDAEERNSSKYHTPFCIFAARKTFDKSPALSSTAFSYLPPLPEPLYPVFSSSSSGLVDISEDVSDFPPLFLQ
jgi:hypothetical protein